MGSVCCTRRSSDGQSIHETSGGWFVDQGIYQWRELSPPFLSNRWDYAAMISNSYSSSSKGGSSIGRTRNHNTRHRRNNSWVFEGNIPYVISSPSESFQADDNLQAHESRSGYVTVHLNNTDSASSNSDMGDYERNLSTHATPQSRPFCYRYSFMSKAVHPMPLSVQIVDADSQEAQMSSMSERSPSTEHRASFRSDNSVQELKFFERPSEYGSPLVSPEYITSFQRNGLSTISTSVSEYDSPLVGPLVSTCEGLICMICNRWLSQKSPWSTQKMIKSRDFPASGVLCCGHVYHADCLEEMIPEAHKHDPPCPICEGAVNHAGHVSGIQGSLPMATGSAITSFRVVNDNNSISSSASHNVYTEDIMNAQQKMNHRRLGSSKKLRKSFSRKMFSWSKSNKKASLIEQNPELPSSTNAHYDAGSSDGVSAGYSMG